MVKRIKDESRNVYVQKQPFYKKVWFWLLVVFLVFIGFGVAGSKDDNGGSKISHKEATSKKINKVNYYKIGDSVKVRNVIYTLKSAEVVSERNEFEEDQPKYVIRVVYHVKNDSDKDIPVGADLDAYGPDNNKLKSYPVSDATLGSVAAGKEMDVIDGFGTDKLGNIELQFAPLVSTAKAAKFKVKVKDINVDNQNVDNTAPPVQQNSTPVSSVQSSQIQQPDSSPSQQAPVGDELSPELKSALEYNHRVEQYINSPAYQESIRNEQGVPQYEPNAK